MTNYYNLIHFPQIVMDCVTNPPKEGDESYPLFLKVDHVVYILLASTIAHSFNCADDLQIYIVDFVQEKNAVLGSLKERSKMVAEAFDSVKGIKCNEVMGAMYAFPQIHIPKKAVEKAKV